jgi:hypothetical protein
MWLIIDVYEIRQVLKNSRQPQVLTEYVFFISNCWYTRSNKTHVMQFLLLKLFV